MVQAVCNSVSPEPYSRFFSPLNYPFHIACSTTFTVKREILHACKYNAKVQYNVFNPVNLLNLNELLI